MPRGWRQPPTTPVPRSPPAASSGSSPTAFEPEQQPPPRRRCRRSRRSLRGKSSHPRRCSAEPSRRSRPRSSRRSAGGVTACQFIIARALVPGVVVELGRHETEVDPGGAEHAATRGCRHGHPERGAAKRHPSAGRRRRAGCRGRGAPRLAARRCRCPARRSALRPVPRPVRPRRAGKGRVRCGGSPGARRKPSGSEPVEASARPRFSTSTRAPVGGPGPVEGGGVGAGVVVPVDAVPGQGQRDARDMVDRSVHSRCGSLPPYPGRHGEIPLHSSRARDTRPSPGRTSSARPAPATP